MTTTQTAPRTISRSNTRTPETVGIAWAKMGPAAFGVPAAAAQESLFALPDGYGTPDMLAGPACGQCGARGQIMDMWAEDRCADVLACLDRRPVPAYPAGAADLWRTMEPADDAQRRAPQCSCADGYAAGHQHHEPACALYVSGSLSACILVTS